VRFILTACPIFSRVGQAEAKAKMQQLEAAVVSGGSGGSREEVLQLQLQLSTADKTAAARDATLRQTEISLAKVTAEHAHAQEQLARAQEQLQRRDMAAAVDQLQQQLAERTRELEQHRAQAERLRAQHEREERLLVTAWYDMGQQVQRLAAAAASSNGSAFLPRQRQAALTRHTVEST
jgi:hypothetical protein